MPLNKIHRDPQNARRPEDEKSAEGIEAQVELTKDIKKRGVRSPISLRPHSSIAGEYVINFGHRRFEGAVNAGLKTIPYFVDTTFDSYDQVKENLLHRKPSVWALADFVQRQLNQKHSKSEIAEGLGKANQNLVTELQALVDAPKCLHDVYETGIKSTRTLYDLRRAYDEFPDQIEAWCASGAKITRDTIQALLYELRNAGIPEQSVQKRTRLGPRVARSTITDEIQEVTDRPTAQRSGPVEPDRLARVDESPAACTQPEGQVACQTDPYARLATVGKLRHDVKAVQPADQPEPTRAAVESAGIASGILVEYRGMPARIAPDSPVLILVDGNATPFKVSASDLLFRNVFVRE
jgi:ParB/RepB/Spo0J family partition protein